MKQEIYDALLENLHDLRKKTQQICFDLAKQPKHPDPLQIEDLIRAGKYDEMRQQLSTIKLSETPRRIAGVNDYFDLLEELLLLRTDNPEAAAHRGIEIMVKRPLVTMGTERSAYRHYLNAVLDVAHEIATKSHYSFSEEHLQRAIQRRMENHGREV